MNLLNVYHELPAPLRSVAVSARGLQLRMRRYGARTEPLVRAALDREQWSEADWDEWRRPLLRALLLRASTRVPFYRDYWSTRASEFKAGAWEHLENWPIVEKEALRQRPRSFVADDSNIRWMSYEQTSGTTGKPVELWFPRKTVVAWYALFEARWRRWYGLSRHDRWANVGGQLVCPVSRTSPPFWVWNAALNQLYMSSYHLKAEWIPLYLEALQEYRVRYIWAYASSAFRLATGALEAGGTAFRPDVVITNAEPLLDHQRRTISEAFDCPVRETYGMSESVIGASECGHGHLHLWPDAGVVEVLDGTEPVAAGSPGDLVCTGLLNSEMPLVRYRVGDRVTLASGSQVCHCGSKLPMLLRVEGRSDDTVYAVDGREIGRLDPVFKANLHISEAQIDQEALGRFRIRVVPTSGYTTEDADAMAARLRDRVGEAQIIVEAVTAVRRTEQGKFRAVVCSIPEGERQWIKGRHARTVPDSEDRAYP